MSDENHPMDKVVKLTSRVGACRALGDQIVQLMDDFLNEGIHVDEADMKDSVPTLIEHTAAELVRHAAAMRELMK